MLNAIQTWISTSRIRDINVRQVRLISGLIIFTYVLMHLVNHALGNISIAAAEAMLVGMKWFWRGPVGTLALYPALIAHTGLGFWALYQRRAFRFRAVEVVQLVLGMLIPFMLMNHIVVTRLAWTLDGISKGYAQEFYSFWVASPLILGINQALVLVIAWVHGCIGVFLWLRLKRFFARWALVLLSAAVLIPTLALLGDYQGGRVVMELAQQKAWHDANLTALEVGTLAERAQLANVRIGLLLLYTGLLAAVFAARAVRSYRETRAGVVELTYPDRRTIKVPVGLSLLEASTMYEMPHAGVCGGRGRCGTCRVSVLDGRDNLPPPGAVEEAILKRVGVAAESSVRIGCQARPTGDVTFVPMLPPSASTAYAYGGRRVRPGHRRHVVSMFVEMRDIAAYDGKQTVDPLFVTNRFLEAAIKAVHEAGGEANRFYGNGMLALFGLDTEPDVACRRALEAAAMVSVNTEHMSSLLGKDLKEPIQFVIGLHAGEVTLGEIGYQDDLAFTAVGSSVRDAAQLLDIARLMPCEVLISETVCTAAGLRAGVLTAREVIMPGSDRTMMVRAAGEAVALFGALDAIVDDATRQPEPTTGTLAPA